MSLVRDVLKNKDVKVWTIDCGATAMDATIRMNEHRIGAMVVMDGDKIAGIFTERDLLNRVVAAKKDPSATPIRDVMTSRLACCTLDTTVEECRTVMTSHKMRHLPVVENDKLLGIISSGDILARKVVDHEETIRYLHEYMHGSS